MLSLSDSMHELAKALVSLPSDLRVDVMVSTKINEDVPNDFIETPTTVESDNTRYERIVEAINGIATKTIILHIAD